MRQFSTWLIVVSLSLGACQTPQPKVDADVIKALSVQMMARLARADSLREKANDHDALKLYIEIGNESNASTVAFDLNAGLGLCYWNIRDRINARKYLRRALEVQSNSPKIQARAAFILAEIYATERAHLDSAVEYRLQTIAFNEKISDNDTAIVKSHVRAGKLYQILHQHELADDQLEKAKMLAEKTPAVGFDDLVDVYFDLARSKIELKDNPDAVVLVQKALATIIRHSPSDFNRQGRAYSLLASIYERKKQYDLAISSYQRALAFYERGNNPSQLATIHSNISIIYRIVGNFPAALHSVDESIRYNSAIFGENSSQLAVQYLRKGYMLQQLKDLDAAKVLYWKSLAIRKQIFGEKNIYAFGVRSTLGSFYEEQGLIDSAIWYYQGSLISLVRDFNDTAWEKNPSPNAGEMSSDLRDAFIQKGRALIKKSTKDPDPSRYLKISLACMKTADSVVAEYRKYLSFQDMHMNFLNEYTIPYEQAMDCAFRLTELTHDEKFLEDAFYLMERSRATLVEEALNKAQSFSRTGLPLDFLAKENELIAERAKLINLYNVNAADSIGAELLTINAKIYELRTSFERMNPGYATLRYGNEPPSIQKMREFAASRNAAVAEYFWGRENLFVLFIGSDKVRLKKIPISNDLLQSLDYVLNSVRLGPHDISSTVDFKNYSKHAARLYHILLGDADPKKGLPSRLIVSPHGRLSSLPFEVLITQLPDSTEVSYKLRYLLKDHTISYSYSARSLVQDRIANDGNKLLAMGFSDNTSMPNGLPGTTKEIDAIKDVMDDDANEYYLSADASESAFKQSASGFNIIHLAVHGVADTLDGLKSRLIFRNEADTTEDGNLYAYELYGMNLSNASLVVLSACESGLGKDQIGEGPLSISRGFSYAGCPLQVISLWKINDQASAGIMADFYRHFSNGDPVDLSLQSAKLDYLNTANEFNSHPRYWAAFLPVGNATSSRDSFWRQNVLRGGLLLTVILAIVASLRYFGFNFSRKA